MRTISRLIFLCFLICFTSVCLSADKIPLRDFFKNPEQSNFQVSRNAIYIAYLKPWHNRMNIFIKKLSADYLPTGKEKQITFVKDRDIDSFFWKGDKTIVYLKDQGGDENFHVYSTDIYGGKDIDLTPFKDSRNIVYNRLTNASDTDILVTSNRRNTEVFDIYRINTQTKHSEMVAQNTGKIWVWLADHTGAVRMAIENDGLSKHVLSRKTDQETFKKILTFNYTDDISLLLFTPDNKYAYVASNLGRDKKAIVLIDPNNGQELEVLFEHPDVDVMELHYLPDRITAAFFTTWRQEIHFFDEIVKQRITRIKEQVGDLQIDTLSGNKAQDIFTIMVSDDKGSATYLYDDKKNLLTLLYDTAKYLPRDKLAQMRPIQYKSRDDLIIHGYLTLPNNSSEKNLPVIVIPHGGPWGIRDAWGYDPEVQFLANRGYAVLQVNFRGSIGYGKDFYKRSFKQWGRAMQNDLTDGVEWLIKQGIADPRHIGIYGASYGGYAVLAGLAFTPNLYACGVDYVGPANLFTLLDTFPKYWSPVKAMWLERLGDPIKDKELLEAISPVFHVDQIKAPLLVAQGAQDPRVNINESNQIVQALRDRGVEVEYLVKENEGHGFHNEENRFEFYEAMERFLAKYLH